MKTLKSTFENKKVLITGHTGFKGTWLSIWLKYLGANVYGISKEIPTNPSIYESSNISDNITDIRIDICENKKIKDKILEINPDFIFHLAAQPIVKDSYDDPLRTWNTNTIGTINILESIKEIESELTVVFITSDKCYDNVEWDWGYRENDKLGGPDPYSASKAGAEIAISSYFRSFLYKKKNIKIGVGRAGNVIGGGDWAKYRIVPDAVRAWTANEPLELRNPYATRPWQHVLEPLSGYLTLAYHLTQDKKYDGEAFNFGPATDQNFSVGSLINKMSYYWNKAQWIDNSNKQTNQYESTLLKLNCDKALAKLNWKSIWSFEKTVKETTEWYKNYYSTDRKNILDFSVEQIIRYSEDAKTNCVKWAQ